MRSRCFQVDEGIEVVDLKQANDGKKVKTLMVDDERDAVYQGWDTMRFRCT